MKTVLRSIFGFAGFLTAFALPARLLAYVELDPGTVINDAAPGLTDVIATASPSSTLTEAVPVFFAEQAVLLVTAIAIISGLVAGLRLAFSQSEEAINVARRTFIGGATAIILCALALRIRNALFQSLSTNVISDPGNAATILCEEGYGVIDLIQIPLIAVAVLMIILHGTRAVISYGTDDGATALRRAVLSTIFGVLIIAIREVFTEAVLDSTACAAGTSGSPDPIIDEIIRILNLILSFVGLLAVVAICIAGMMMIVNIGNDDQYSRARSLLLRVIIGLLVILISLGLVNVLITGLTS